MQPDHSEASKEALLLLTTTGVCKFDLAMKGAWLRPIRFGSRAYTDREVHFHSFVGETGCGRWAISSNKKFLWGAEFYWLCDWAGIKDCLLYTSPSPRD